MTLEQRLQQIQYCLIRAKVDIEFGMERNHTPFFIDALKEIEKACDFAFYDKDKNL